MIGNASMSPMPISIRGKSWPRASGWRATPSTVREDTSPSPTPAPIAPPAMIKPAATSPAPMMIACSTSSSLCDCRLPGFVVFHCLPEVRDREHSEDECLDRPDEDAEGDPDDVEDKDRDHPEDRECPDQDVAERSMKDQANAQQEASAEERDHEQHHLAGQDVAEEPEGERYRFRQLFDEVDRRENGKGLEEVFQIPAEAPVPDRVVLNEDEGHECECQGTVQIGGPGRGTNAPGVAQGQPDWHDEKKGKRAGQRGDLPAALAASTLGRAAHEC